MEHLGDGVYVSYDGYNVNIAVNDHKNHVVSLDPEVTQRLINFCEYIKLSGPMKVYYSIGGFKKMQVEFDHAVTDEEIVEYFELRYPDNNVTWHR